MLIQQARSARSASKMRWSAKVINYSPVASWQVQRSAARELYANETGRPEGQTRKIFYASTRLSKNLMATVQYKFLVNVLLTRGGNWEIPSISPNIDARMNGGLLSFSW